jgi:hypothetical protein
VYQSRLNFLEVMMLDPLYFNEFTSMILEVNFKKLLSVLMIEL